MYTLICIHVYMAKLDTAVHSLVHVWYFRYVQNTNKHTRTLYRMLFHIICDGIVLIFCLAFCLIYCLWFWNARVQFCVPTWMHRDISPSEFSFTLPLRPTHPATLLPRNTPRRHSVITALFYVDVLVCIYSFTYAMFHVLLTLPTLSWTCVNRYVGIVALN